METYQETIRRETAKMEFIGKYDPRHIEGWMRIEHGTLDHLDIHIFRKEIKIGIQCIEEGGRELAERNAKSFGL